MNPNPIEVFVYGTLKRGLSNHRQLEGATFVAQARTKPVYRLYALDGYPGMVDAGGAGAGAEGKSIPGEIWRVPADCWKRLDEFEGVAEGLYARVEVQLEPPNDRPGIATYLYLQSVVGRPEISLWNE